MATLHTNFLTGNDTTGDGTASLPWKTVSKALTLAADTDLVKVAGGEFVQLAGTVTVSARATTMTTSTNLTGSLAIKDIIALDTQSVDGFTIEQTLFVVTAINATTITISGTAYVRTGTYNIYKMNSVPYASTITTSSIETFSSIPASNVTVSGGWSTDFTTQIGWTAANFGTTGAVTGAFLFNMNFITGNKSGIVFDKFLVASGNFITTSANTSIGIDTLIGLGSNTLFVTNMDIVSPVSKGYTTLYLCQTSINGTWQGGVLRPTTLDLKQWVSGNASGHHLKTGSTVAFQGSSNGPSIKTSEGYWRAAGTTVINSANSPINLPAAGGDVYIDYLKMVLTGNDSVHPIVSQSTGTYDLGYRFIKNIDTLVVGTNAGVIPCTNTDTNSPSYQVAFNLNRTSGPIDELNWLNHGQRNTIQQWYKTGINSMFGKDTEGQKVINNDVIVKYADPTQYVTGTNSLRMKLAPNTNPAWWNSYICATLDKPTASSFTITIKAKASKTVTVDSVRLLYGVAQELDRALPGITLTTSWQDFAFTINPVADGILNWNLCDANGLMSVLLRIISTQTSVGANDYIWIDSVTVS